MNTKELFTRQSWKHLGTWFEPPVLQVLVTRSCVSRIIDAAFRFPADGYCDLKFKQHTEQASYEKGIESMKRELLNDTSGTVLRMKNHIDRTSRELELFPLDITNSKSVERYFEMVERHGRNWCEIMLLDGALGELYPASLPAQFELNGKIMTAAQLFSLTGLPKHMFPMIAERYHFLEMKIAEKSGEDISGKLDKHAELFGWTNSFDWWYEPFTSEDYRKKLEEYQDDPVLELKRLKENRDKQYESAEMLLAELHKKYPDTWKFLDAIRDLTDLREENWDAVSKAGTRWRPAFKKLSAQHFLSYHQLMAHTPEELVGIVAGDSPLDANELNERIENFGVIVTPDETLIISGEKVTVCLTYLDKEIPETDSIAGTVIWSGTVRGSARVLFSADEVNEIQAGEILICPMTDPDYMPAVHKAAAMVTDQGGLLCHAAIVARELQKPCIVGTEIATKIFRTGDMVEVDGERGIVRKI